MSVDINTSVHIHTLEIDGSKRFPYIFITCESLSIPSYARGKIAAIVTRRIVQGRYALNTPVMGQVQRAPATVIKVGSVGFIDIS